MRKGLTVVIAGYSLLLHRVPSELIPQRGQNLRAIGFRLARAKPRLQGQRDDRRGDVLINGCLYGPAPLAGVFDPALD